MVFGFLGLFGFLGFPQSSLWRLFSFTANVL
jgi:hypothetical protein